MIDRDIERTSPEAPGGSAPDQVVLAEYGLDLTKMCVLPLIAEPDFFAVRQKDERDIELIRISAALSFPGAQIDACTLGFENRKRPPLAIEQGVIRLAAIVERVFEPDAAPVCQLPIDIPQELVDLDPREGLVGHARSVSL
jgi:hypothetical protein